MKMKIKRIRRYFFCICFVIVFFLFLKNFLILQFFMFYLLFCNFFLILQSFYSKFVCLFFLTLLRKFYNSWNKIIILFCWTYVRMCGMFTIVFERIFFDICFVIVGFFLFVLPNGWFCPFLKVCRVCYIFYPYAVFVFVIIFDVESNTHT